MRHVEGAPFGTRGGISVMHTFPADGEYTFRMQLHSIPTGQLFGSTVRASCSKCRSMASAWPCSRSTRA